jgi:ribosomal protein L32
MKITHSKTASRRAHHHATGASVVKTSTGVRRKHFVDPATGMYRGKQILNVTGKKTVTVSKKKVVKKAVKAEGAKEKVAPKKKVAKKEVKKS